MWPSPEPDCWLHPAVQVHSSPIEGAGLFATVDLPPGTPVSRLGGRLVTGTELHPNDYATSTGEPVFTMECRCGTPLCRNQITGTDWRRPDLQARYGNHWVPALLHQITAAG